MSLSAYVRDSYRLLYTSLKSEEMVNRIGNSTLSKEEKEAVVGTVRRLAHPSVATAWDAYEVSRLCISGLLPGVPKDVVENARRLLGEVKKQYPFVEARESLPTPPELGENPSVQELGRALAWSNRMIARLAAISISTQDKVASSLKGECPFCLEGMTVTVRENGIILKCSEGSTAACKRTQWRIRLSDEGV